MDASDKGWGTVNNQPTWSVTWASTDKQKHINWEELQAIYLAVTPLEVQGQMVNLICGNSTAIAYVETFRGARSPLLMELADRIWRHCLATGTRLRTTYVPSAFNPADDPSRRLQNQLEWSLDPSFFQSLGQTWSPPPHRPV